MIKIRAKTAAGASLWSTDVYAVTVGLPTMGAVMLVTATQDSLMVRWNTPADASGLTGYDLYFYPAGAIEPTLDMVHYKPATDSYSP